MSRLIAQPTWLLFLCLSAQANDHAQRASVEAHSKHTFDSTTSDNNTRLSQQWGLKTEELDRYRTLMEGPLGTYSPNLDPLSALGIEARTEAERQRYARLQVEAEAIRVEKLLVYQRAYDHAWKERYPDMALINLPPINSPLMINTAKRVAVFVQYQCPGCERTVRALHESGSPFDLYMVNSQQDDRRIRQWVQLVGIDAVKVRDGTITINHDNGRWRAIDATGELPAVLHKVNGKWVRQ